MAKEPEPGSTGESHDSVGSLSAYVSGRLDDIARQKAEAEAQALVAKDREMELFLQKTASLREYLLELAAPMEELLSRFRVRELLEKVRSNYSRNGKIRTVVPDIYKRIVTEPDPSTHHLYEIYNATNSQNLTLSGLLSSGDFQSVIPSLIGYADILNQTQPMHAFGKYGLVLQREVPMRFEKTRLETPRQTYRWLGPGGGSVIEGGREFVAVGTGKWENGYGVESLLVEVIKIDEFNPIYALQYSRMRSGDLVARPRRINGDQSPEVLKQLIGDNIVKTINRTV